MRKGEAAHLEWKDLDFAAGEIVVRGDPETGTKNWEVRRAPMISAALALFEQMWSERTEEPETQKVFQVREAQKAIEAMKFAAGGTSGNTGAGGATALVLAVDLHTRPGLFVVLDGLDPIAKRQRPLDREVHQRAG